MAPGCVRRCRFVGRFRPMHDRRWWRVTLVALLLSGFVVATSASARATGVTTYRVGIGSHVFGTSSSCKDSIAKRLKGLETALAPGGKYADVGGGGYDKLVRTARENVDRGNYSSAGERLARIAISLTIWLSFVPHNATDQQLMYSLIDELASIATSIDSCRKTSSSS